MTWSPKAEAFEAEKHMIPSVYWHAHFKNLPKEWADKLRTHRKDPFNGEPTGLALVPGKGYCILACGQGPFIVWKEWEKRVKKVTK